MRILSTILIVLVLLTSFAFAENELPPADVEIGAKLPGGKIPMKDLLGKEQTLNVLNGENGLLVIFSCNTCPFVIEWEDRYNEMADLAKTAGINTVAINSNEAKREGVDSMKEMQEHAKEKGYEFPYLVDDHSKVALAFGARFTPQVYLFDKNLELVFKGAIDDRYENRDRSVKKEYLKEAIEKLNKGESIDPAVTKPKGCSIKKLI